MAYTLPSFPCHQIQLADLPLPVVPNPGASVCTAARLTHQLQGGGSLLRRQSFVPCFCPMTNAYPSCTAWSASLWEIIIVSLFPRFRKWDGVRMMPQFKLHPWVYPKVGMVPDIWARQMRNSSSPSCLQAHPEAHLSIRLLSCLDTAGWGPAHLPFFYLSVKGGKGMKEPLRPTFLWGMG